MQLLLSLLVVQLTKEVACGSVGKARGRRKKICFSSSKRIQTGGLGRIQPLTNPTKLEFCIKRQPSHFCFPLTIPVTGYCLYNISVQLVSQENCRAEKREKVSGLLVTLSPSPRDSWLTLVQSPEFHAQVTLQEIFNCNNMLSILRGGLLQANTRKYLCTLIYFALGKWQHSYCALY